MIGRSDDPEHPARITGVPKPRTCLGLDRGTHLGQRHVPRKQAGHMTAHRTVVDSSLVTPCTPGPSTHDPGICCTPERPYRRKQMAGSSPAMTR
jgi:hypothetical protein